MQGLILGEPLTQALLPKKEKKQDPRTPTTQVGWVRRRCPGLEGRWEAAGGECCQKGLQSCRWVGMAVVCRKEVGVSPAQRT